MNNEEQKIGRNNSPYRENVSAPDLTMNNESKCCECEKPVPSASGLFCLVCEESLRPAHTPAPEDWEEEARVIFKQCLEAPGKNLAFEDYMLPFLRSEKAAAQDEGVRIAYSSAMYVTREGIVLKNPTEVAYEKGRKDAAKEMLDAARSEGVNG